VKRAQVVSLYCLLVGGSGWLLLLLTPQPAVPLPVLLLFGLVALLIDMLGFRWPPGDPHSLVGVILLAAALALGPPAGALIAAGEGLLFGLVLPFIYGFPRTCYTLVGRPVLRSGLRVLGILGGAALAHLLAAAGSVEPAMPLLLASMILGYGALLQLGRIGREYLQGGWTGVQTWWHSVWRLAWSAELAPLPLAALIAAIYSDLGVGYFLLASVGLIATSAIVRRTRLRLQTQRRSVRELALLNEVSRAIIRSEQDVAALCELIYRETSKIVDTSSFHLGLFVGTSFTLLVRVQDRVRLPSLTVNLETGDGLIGWLRQTGRALLVEDFAKEMERLPARPRYQSEHPPRSGIYVPLIAGDTVIGSISIQSYRPAAFDANDLRLLSLIADQAAVAITRARAFAETRQRARQLQAIHQVSAHVTAILDLEELLPAVVRLIRRYFHYHPVHIFTTTTNSDIITFCASTADDDDTSDTAHMQTRLLRTGQGLVGSAVASGQPVLVGDVRSDARYIDDYSATRSELAVPLRVGEQILGVLDVQSAQPDDFDEDDLFVMRTLADQIAIAIDSANSYAAQQEEAWTLNALLQVSENIGQAATLDELLPTLVRLPPLLVGCDRCYCLLWEREEHCFKILAAYGLKRTQREQLLGQCIAMQAAPLLDRMQHDLVPVRLTNAQTQRAAFPQIIAVCGSGTLDLLPLLARASLIGVLIIDYDAPDRPAHPRHRALYDGAIGQIARALESVLLSNEAAEAERLEQELRVAREIQTSLLPAAPPRLPGWDIAADWRSARLVGGDFFDFWELPPKHKQSATAAEPTSLGLVIADVSDKGVPAAMFMALARSLVRAAALDGSPPPRALERANRWITRDSESGMFVTLFYARLETATGELCYTSAGHNPPLLYRPATRTFEELWTPGIALGVLEEVQLPAATVTLAPGDLLVCYTDGVTEAINEQTEPFAKSRLCELIVQHHATSADVLLTAITTAVARFTHGQEPFDDITLVVVKREVDGWDLGV
jgi:serine phosphatase RsbU (regulator of sigma subunit)/putative methionine-R-sulfoxide reductase with GAF domain